MQKFLMLTITFLCTTVAINAMEASYEEHITQAIQKGEMEQVESLLENSVVIHSLSGNNVVNIFSALIVSENDNNSSNSAESISDVYGRCAQKLLSSSRKLIDKEQILKIFEMTLKYELLSISKVLCETPWFFDVVKNHIPDLTIQKISEIQNHLMSFVRSLNHM